MPHIEMYICNMLHLNKICEDTFVFLRRILIMADNEYWYRYYRQKYYNSCSEISNCDNRIYNLNNQRNQTVNMINQLRAEIYKTQLAIDDITQAINCEASLNSKLAIVESKTSQAAENFTGMVKSSSVNSKDLNDVYSNETAETKRTLNNVLGTLRTEKNNLNSKITDLQTNLNRLNGDLQSIDSDIRITNSDLLYWKQQKTSNYYNMEYYRRKAMQEA